MLNKNFHELQKDAIENDSYMKKCDQLNVLLTGHHIYEIEVETDDFIEISRKLYKQIERIEELESELEGRTKEERLKYDSEYIISLKNSDEEKLDKLLNNEKFWKLFKERYGEDSIYSKAISEED